MQTSARQQQLERLYNSRRGHVPQISISDDTHHITEAIGSYYEEQEPDLKDLRPLSFLPATSDTAETSRSSRRQGSIFDPLKFQTANALRSLPTKSPTTDEFPHSPEDGSMKSIEPEVSLQRTASTEQDTRQSTANGRQRRNSGEIAVQQFPLNDIDYESSPAAVAQELSNLQAIRRMSMNVDYADPDLPSFSSGFAGMPQVAPRHDDDDDDAAQLFWVPARLHPELAPKEFRTFVEDRVERIRRRSGGEDTLTSDGLERSISANSNLRRKKSMLSHSIDTKGSYEDGAERLERKRSAGRPLEGQRLIANLADLETLVNDPEQAIRRLSLDQRRSDESYESVGQDDAPILPAVGQALKRSTRTAYRRGSLRKGERVPFSKRLLQRHNEADAIGERSYPSRPSEDDDVTETSAQLATVHVKTESARSLSKHTMHEDDERQSNTSPEHQRHVSTRSHSSEDAADRQYGTYEHEVADDHDTIPSHQSQVSQSNVNILAERPPRSSSHRQPRTFQSRLVSGPGRTTAQLPGYNNPDPLPNPLEVRDEQGGSFVQNHAGQSTAQVNTPPPISQNQPQQPYPTRKSSQDSAGSPMQLSGPYLRSASERPASNAPTLDDLSARPSPMPGSADSRTDALTIVPTFEPKKPEKKEGGRKSSWKWILGNDDDDKKNKDDKTAEGKTKSSKSAKAQAMDRARLDVLQHSIDGGDTSRGRESLVLNRSDFKVTEDDRKKEGKKSNESKKDKEKEPGLLQAIFGGKKKNSDGDLKEKKRRADRGSSPDMVMKILKPDIDYNWTRFSILEERAIYRMAHIKLANPRRALHSQVLLSNFMYSYLAKVQMMHPQTQVAASPQGQPRARAQEHGQQQHANASSDRERPAEYEHYQRYQEQQSRQIEAEQAARNEEKQRNERQNGHDVVNGAFSNAGSGANYGHSPYNDVGANNPYQYAEAHDGLPVNDRTPGDGPNGYEGAQPVSNADSRRDYKVASTHDYLGYAKDQQPFGSASLWEDEKSEDLW